MPPFLGHLYWSSFNDKTPFPGVKARLTYCIHANRFVFLNLKGYISDLFDGLCSEKT